MDKYELKPGIKLFNNQQRISRIFIYFSAFIIFIAFLLGINIADNERDIDYL